MIVALVGVGVAVLAQAPPDVKRARVGAYDTHDGDGVAARCRFLDDLPDPIIVDIVQRLDPRSAVQVAATCRALQETCAAVVAFRTLFHHEAPERDLRRRSAAFVRIGGPYRNEVTPEQCLVLYDRIVDSGLAWDRKYRVLAVLARHVACFGDFLLSLRIPPKAAESEADLRKLAWRLLRVPVPPVAPDVADRIPDAVMALVRKSADDVAEAVRRCPQPITPGRLAVISLFRQRYPPPFNEILVWTQHVADRILLQVPDPDVLARRDVVLALARCGLRFDILLFLRRVRLPASSVPDLYPFLLKSRLMDDATKLLWLRWEHHEALLRIPEFISVLHRHPAQLAAYVAKMLERHWVRLLDTVHLLQLDNRILNAAIVQGDVNIVEMLLSSWCFDLYTKAEVPGHEDGPDQCPLQLLFQNDELVDRVVLNSVFCARVSEETQTLLESSRNSADGEYARVISSMIPIMQHFFDI